jgi:hypothetical protein
MLAAYRRGQSADRAVFRSCQNQQRCLCIALSLVRLR